MSPYTHLGLVLRCCKPFPFPPQKSFRFRFPFPFPVPVSRFRQPWAMERISAAHLSFLFLTSGGRGIFEFGTVLLTRQTPKTGQPVNLPKQYRGLTLFHSDWPKFNKQ
eukprot:366564-Chlamydomonas_euryale.AAC.19